MQLPYIFLQIRKADRQLNQLYGKFLARNGMRITQYGLLRAIAGLEEPSITEIGRVLGIDQTTVTRNVEKLEKLGLVTNIQAPADSRKKIMQLTTLGTNSLKEAHPSWEEAQQLMISELGDDDAQELLRLLTKVSRIVEKDSG